MMHEQGLSGVLDTLCPMHVALDATGHMTHIGPTLRKLRGERALRGRRFLEVFELYRPRAVDTMPGLIATNGRKLHLRFRDLPATHLKGLLVPSLVPGSAIINLSFGISIVEAVQDYALTSADFSATDLTVEMLYLIEAKSAAMAASRKLNQSLQGAMIAAEEQAFTDTLTGLKNRRALEHILPRTLGRRSDFTLMQLDLDYFKAVNDTLGHAAGDLVLQAVARVLVDETCNADTVARIGGDEFVLLLAGRGCERDMSDIAGRIIQRLQRPIPYHDQECRISASIGIVKWCATDAPVAPDTLLEQADMALYVSKRMGRSRFTFYDPAMATGSALPGRGRRAQGNRLGARPDP